MGLLLLVVVFVVAGEAKSKEGEWGGGPKNKRGRNRKQTPIWNKQPFVKVTTSRAPSQRRIPSIIHPSSIHHPSTSSSRPSIHSSLPSCRARLHFPADERFVTHSPNSRLVAPAPPRCSTTLQRPPRPRKPRQKRQTIPRNAPDIHSPARVRGGGWQKRVRSSYSSVERSAGRYGLGRNAWVY